MVSMNDAPTMSDVTVRSADTDADADGGLPVPENAVSGAPVQTAPAASTAVANPTRQKPQVYAGMDLRERLRQKAIELNQKLGRSVARKTSYDITPCTEYDEEVKAEYEIVDQLLYIQNCRVSLECCLEKGMARIRFSWRNSTNNTATRFRKLSQGRVEVTGMQLPV